MDKVNQASTPATVPDVDNADLTGRTLGDFKVIRRLGKGGMGQVFLAEQISLKRNVALKLLRTDLANNPQALERFRAEAQAVARATHANIVQVYFTGEADGLQFMALEYVEGRTLREFVDKKGSPDAGLAFSIMRQGASALLRAAELGIVHRDIKPDNILLTRKGEVKIADFGLARVLDGDRPALNLTQTGVVMGTPLYMSPEQVEGKPLDARSDIYSFGVTCYHMLTGQPPFRGNTAVEVALQHLQKEPPPLATVRPDLPAELSAIIHKMMAKDPAQRYQTSRELLRDIVRVRDQVATTGATPRADLSPSVELLPATVTTPNGGSPSPTTILTSFLRQRRWLPFAVAGSLILAVAVGAVFGLARKRSRPAVAETESGEINPPADVKQVEAILSKKRREEGLLAAVDPFLRPPDVSRVDKLPAGFELSTELALFYLQESKLDEAKAFFGRLEAITQMRTYNLLGRLGRSIVLALQSKAKESNGLFRDLAEVAPFRALGKRLEKAELKKKVNPELMIWANPGLRFWIAEALHYNQRNGIPDADVPQVFLQLRKRAEAAARSER